MNLEKWVNANGLVLNLKKTNYMIFANQKVQDLSFKPKIFDYDILRQNSARFLGLIINENLIWKDHILSVKAKMSRYVGILYKLKKYYRSLPIKIYSIALFNHTVTIVLLSAALAPNLT